MDKNVWHLLTVIGEDRPDIVASVTNALYEGGCNSGARSINKDNPCCVIS